MLFQFETATTTDDSDNNGNNDDDDDGDDDDDNYVSISARSLPVELGAVVIRHCSRPSIMSEPPLLHEDVRQEGGTKKKQGGTKAEPHFACEFRKPQSWK